MPSAIAGAFTHAVFLPIHWIYEGREGTEYFGALVWAVAVLALALLGASAFRVVGALSAFAQLKKTWIGPNDRRQPIVTDADMAGISLVGIVRTTIVIGTCVQESLTREELEVALAHEAAHRRGWDNAKRFAIFAAPDVLRFTRAGRELERRWSAEVECLADARAVERNDSRAANLASALLKVARLAANGPRVSAGPLWSTFYDEVLLETRVRRLVDGPVDAPRPSWTLVSMSLASAAMLLGAAWIAGVPGAVHFATENLVRLLP
jgi:beta-lactamase regulating signal transducer with metallopeptidase domain